MLGDFRHRIHPRGVLSNTVERALLATGALLVTLLTLWVLFVEVYLRLG